MLEQELLALPSVSLVSMLGTRDYEIAIEVREETLRQFGLTIDEVASANNPTSRSKAAPITRAPITKLANTGVPVRALA